MSKEIQTQVLIVGGGGCGLSSSIFLSKLGVSSILVERHPSPGRMPKARYINQRTMEVFRQYNAADAIYAKSMPLKHISHIRWSSSLGGEGPTDRQTLFRLESFGGGALTDYAKDSPCESTLYPQVRLEPLLASLAAGEALGDVRYNNELVDFSEDEEGVTAVILDRTAQTTYRVRAQYVIAADGGKTVGPKVGSVLSGPTNLTDMVTVYFRADLSDHWPDDEAMTTWFVNPEGGSWASGVLGQLGPTRFGRHSEEWMFHFSFRPDDPARHDDARLVPRMRELLKLPDLDPEVLGVGHWVVEGVLADRYRFGRIFLGGDAAHRHPPTTGLGLNSAVQDAHNLTWKLAAVLKGQAGDQLLDSYEIERREVGRRNVDWALLTYSNHALTDAAIGLAKDNPETSLRNFRALFDQDSGGQLRRARLARIMTVHEMEFQAHDLELGFYYSTGALVGDGTSAPARDPSGRTYRPTTRPGHRFPHARLKGPDGELSSLDLIAPGSFVLVIGASGDPWMAAALSIAASGSPLAVARIGDGGEYSDPYRDYMAVREVPDAGAVLVRPDGHVAWRSFVSSGEAEVELRSVIGQILCTTT